MNSDSQKSTRTQKGIEISVITAVYNRARNLPNALASIAEQRHRAVQHIVIDGASTDGTLEILRANRDGLSVLVSEPDKGVYDALNKGLALASGDVVGFLHSDDVFAHPLVLQRIASAFEDDAVEAVYGDLQYVSPDDALHVIRHWSAGTYSQGRLNWGWMPPHPTLFMRRHVYEQLGPFDTSFRIAADYDHILRCFGTGRIHVNYIPEVLVKMSVGGISNRSLGHVLQKSGEDLRAMRKNGIGGIGALGWKNLSKIPQFFSREVRAKHSINLEKHS